MRVRLLRVSSIANQTSDSRESTAHSDQNQLSSGRRGRRTSTLQRVLSQLAIAPANYHIRAKRYPEQSGSNPDSCSKLVKCLSVTSYKERIGFTVRSPSCSINGIGTAIDHVYSSIIHATVIWGAEDPASLRSVTTSRSSAAQGLLIRSSICLRTGQGVRCRDLPTDASTTDVFNPHAVSKHPIERSAQNCWTIRVKPDPGGHGHDP
jgi:hypothetical protein